MALNQAVIFPQGVGRTEPSKGLGVRLLLGRDRSRRPNSTFPIGISRFIPHIFRHKSILTNSKEGFGTLSPVDVGRAGPVVVMGVVILVARPSLTGICEVTGTSNRTFAPSARPVELV